MFMKMNCFLMVPTYFKVASMTARKRKNIYIIPGIGTRTCGSVRHHGGYTSFSAGVKPDVNDARRPLTIALNFVTGLSVARVAKWWEGFLACCLRNVRHYQYSLAMMFSLAMTVSLSIVKPVTGSCPEGSGPRFCNGAAIVPQLYCTGVEHDDDWVCTRKRNVRCGCNANLYRRHDRKCVKKDDCEDQSKKQEIQQAVEIQTPPTTTNGPQNKKYKLTKKILQSQQIFDLLMVSEESWTSNDCLCIKSARLASTLEGAERTIECYTYITVSGAPQTTEYLVGTKKMVKITEEIEFDVKNDGETMILLKPPERANNPTTKKDPPFDLKKEYNVLLARKTCIVVAFEPPVNGKPQCMVLGRVSGNIELSECYNISSLCSVMTDVWESPRSDPCAVFDREEKRRIRKAQDEEGIIQK
ncbi:uncharacterized protein LOC142767101 isoform X2 [Rhipicephalus microplus]|uniref:uncharacterized protein LOC142767101 isoform X2 n=1 Tax=Rhipicephalus microplus TaxID=6941 RepID=UPI003F6C18B1